MFSPIFLGCAFVARKNKQWERELHVHYTRWYCMHEPVSSPRHLPHPHNIGSTRELIEEAT